MQFFPFIRILKPISIGIALLSPLYSANALSGKSSHHGISTGFMDRSVLPLTDFYKFANGKWLQTHEIPDDKTGIGTFYDIHNHNQELLHQILESAAKHPHAAEGSPEKIVGDLYRSGMNFSQIERQGAEPLKEELSLIQSVSSTTSLLKEIAHLHRIGVSTSFRFDVGQDEKNSSELVIGLGQGGLGLPERDYYTRTDAKSVDIREKYLTHIAKMFELMGDNAAEAKTGAAQIISLETKFAGASKTRLALRDPYANYHKMSYSELKSLIPNIEWDTYFKSIGISEPVNIDVGQPEFFKSLAVLLGGENIDTWKLYLRWNLINGAADKLSSKFVDENFHFKGEILSGQKQIPDRWRRMVDSTDRALGDALGQLYVQKAFPPEAKTKALELVRNLMSALHDRLYSLEWMSDSTRTQALKKLDAISVKIGYPDKWKDYSGLQLNKTSYFQNLLAINELEFQRNLNKLGKPVDRSEWHMSPPTVNAYYNSSMNEIVFPAGILQPPFFDPQADDASNYGAIGAIIGHELTHGFDDHGREFDFEGNLKSWWTPADEQNFKARASKLAAQYDGYFVSEGLHINGKLTLGENIADLGGLKIAYVAFKKALAFAPSQKKLDGFTPEQRFFIAFAQNYRSKRRPEVVRMLVQTDTHSVEQFRVVGSLANFPDFFAAFARMGEPSTSVQNPDPIVIW